MASIVKRKSLFENTLHTNVAQSPHERQGTLADRETADESNSILKDGCPIPHKAPHESESTLADQEISDEKSSILENGRPVSPLSAVSALSFGTSSNSTSRKGIISETFNLELIDPRRDQAQKAPGKSRKYVKWGIHWRQPSYILICVFCAISLSLGHHFYYKSLNGTPTGSAIRQQWAITFGTTFSYLVVHLLGAAVVAAYSQYIWFIVRQRGYTLEAIDSFFSMTSDPRAFFNWETLKHGKLAVLLALMGWAMGIASVSPPATLAVISGHTTSLTEWPTLDWGSKNWFGDAPVFLFTAPSVLETATRAAMDMAIVPIPPPSQNSSFNMKFYGPSVQCDVANDTQQQIFDWYLGAMFNSTLVANLDQSDPPVDEAIILTQPTQNMMDTFQAFLEANHMNEVSVESASLLVFSAFTLNDIWEMNSSKAFENPTFDYSFWGITTQQLWLQTSSEGVVCALWNASYDVDFEYVDGIQSISRAVLNLNPVNFELHNIFQAFYSYFSVFTGMVDLLLGNITMHYMGPNQYSAGWLESSQALSSTGLFACPEMSPDYWFRNGPTELRNYSLANGVFNRPPSMCRNGTLARAVEDLFVNITISMLATNNTLNQTIPITYFPYHPLYEYHSQNLIISYSIAIAVTLACLAVGMYSIVANGVSHSTSFSAMIATTRNPKLDALVEGSSLGALPLDRDVHKTRLKFGELLGERSDEGGHIAFGLEDEVLNLRRNGRYT